MNEHPCSDGLSEALRFLRSNRSVQAPRKLWSLLDKLDGTADNYDRYGDYRNSEQSEKDVRREIRKIADDVKIIVKPKVFAERLVQGDEFLEYVEKLLKSRAMTHFKKKAYERVKESLIVSNEIDEQIEDVESRVESGKRSIQQYEQQLREIQQNIRRARSHLRLDEREVMNLKSKKESGEDTNEYLPLNEFDPISLIQDSWNEHDLDEEKRLIIAEEMARALAV